MLRLYCHALTERNVDLQDLKQLVEKNIGWSKSDVATSDGAAIFIPASIERFERQADNFDFLKVMLTQQAGHIEFGSFEFAFDRPATCFDDLRPSCRRRRSITTTIMATKATMKTPAVTELTRFFKLFPNKRLAFGRVLDSRKRARGSARHAGVPRHGAGLPANAPADFKAASGNQLYCRRGKRCSSLIVRLSLGQRKIPMPKKHSGLPRDLRAMVQLLGERGATVEDSAEAALRIYARLAKVKNDYLDENEFVILKAEGRSSSRCKSFKPWSNRWDDEEAVSAATSDLPSLVGREREYLVAAGRRLSR